MAATTSLRSALAYAANFLAQIPFLQDIPNPFTPAIDAGLQGPGEVLSRPLLNHDDDAAAAAAPIISSSSSSSSSSRPRPYEPLSGAPACPIDGPLSCHNSTPIAGDPSCCFVYPGGRILLTQFWDREVHVGGAEEDWTLHGLWPDLCDGTYNTYCGMTPHYSNITQVLSAYNQTELLAFMDRYWVADRGANSNLWMHEFNKHAQCINTLAPACYGDSDSNSDSDSDSDSANANYTPGQEVVDYFTRATGLFRMLDTYTALSLKGIVPHARRHYPLADVRAILEQFSGGKLVLRCTGRARNELHEAWYVYFVQGSLQRGQFVPAQDYGAHGDMNNCAPWVKYLPKRHKK